MASRARQQYGGGRWHKKPPPRDCIVNSIHDEIVAEGPEHQAEQACEIVQQVMEAAGNQLVPSVPIEAEAGVASTWAEK